MRSQEDYDNVIALHLKGFSHKEIEAKLTINRKTVARMIKHHKSNIPCGDSPGEEKKWISKSHPPRAPLEHGINWEQELPLIQNPNLSEANNSPGRRKPTEFIRCPSCGAKIAKNYPCVACYQKLVCFQDQDCYFNELQRVDPLAFPSPQHLDDTR